jgi:hypothetical protein
MKVSGGFLQSLGYSVLDEAVSVSNTGYWIWWNWFGCCSCLGDHKISDMLWVVGVTFCLCALPAVSGHGVHECYIGYLLRGLQHKAGSVMVG